MKPKAQQHMDELGVRYKVLAPLLPVITDAFQLLCDCFRANGQLLLCGNGGSAADCAHIVGEIGKGFRAKRPLPYEDFERLKQTGFPGVEEMAGKLQRGGRALALTAPTSLNTAFSNDVDASLVFAQQVYVHGIPGDVLIGISTSGNSENVVAAMQVAKAFGLKTIGLNGAEPGKMDPFCDVCIKAPAKETYRVQELHLPIYHALCAAVEAELWSL